MNDSSTGGILLPTNQPPLNDAALDSLFQSFFSALTGIILPNVRRRFTAEPQTPPEVNVTWIAVGVSDIADDQFPQQSMNDDGSYTLVRNELLGVLCSFYGDKAQATMRRARDGIMIAQNREFIEAAGIVYMHCEAPIRAPVLVQTRWANRIDVTFTFRRRVVETYAVLNITAVAAEILTDIGLSAPIDITPN